MALKSTIFKAQLAVADIDHGYYADHALTLARHPSETDERMMVRLAALALNAHALQTLCGGDGTLAFGAGLSDPDDPDVWLRDFTGQTKLWIEVGQPDERRIAKASGRSEEVIVIAYGGRTSEIWWQGVRSKVERLRNVTVWSLADGVAEALGKLTERTMRLQCTVQDGQAWIGNGNDDAVAVEWTVFKAPEKV